jgi:hypothetical protein
MAIICRWPPAKAPGRPEGANNVIVGGCWSKVIWASPGALTVVWYLYSKYTLFKPSPRMRVNSVGRLDQLELYSQYWSVESCVIHQSVPARGFAG